MFGHALTAKKSGSEVGDPVPKSSAEESAAIANPKKHKLGRFSEMSSPVKLLVEGDVLLVNEQILRDASPVFEAMLNEPRFKEGKTKEVKLVGKKNADIQMMLSFIHPLEEYERLDLTDTSARILLKLADEYQIADLIQRCEEHLLDEPMKMEHIYLAEQYNLKQLLEKAIVSCGEKTAAKLAKDPYHHKIKLRHLHYIYRLALENKDLGLGRQSYTFTSLASKLKEFLTEGEKS